MDTFIARQPILDRKLQVFGYELLFRSGIENVFRNENAEFATTKLISDAVHIHGIEKITQGHKCFVNFTRQAVLSELYSVLPKEWTVVEILETVELDDDLIDACHRLRRAGYLMALDDYAMEPGFAPILPLIDFLKVEFPVLSDQDHRLVREFSDLHRFSLLAEKVESQEQYHRAREFGYDYFQGYFFCKPQLITARQIPSSRLQSLRLLRLVNDTAFDIDQIEDVIRNDVSFSSGHFSSLLYGRGRRSR